MLYEMRLVGLAMDPFNNSPIVILKDRNVSGDSNQSIVDVELETDSGEALETTLHLETPEGERQSERILPIWIGESEAQSIASVLLGISVSRPMTHDLLKSVISGMGGEVERVVVTDLEENTFYAEIQVSLDNGETLILDSRPSDALALALRCEAKIFVNAKVIEKTYKSETAPQVSDDAIDEFNQDKWEELVEKLTEQSVKKYKQ